MRWLLAGVALALCLRGLRLPSEWGPWLELTVLAAALQVTAVPTERGRFFSTGAAAVLALGLAAGTAGAAVTLVLALGLRWLVRRGSVWEDLLACVVPLALLSVLPPGLLVWQGALVVVNVHLALSWWLGRDSLLEQRLALLRLAVPMLAAIMPALLPWQALWLMPVLFALQFAGERALAVARQHQVETLERQVSRVQTQVWDVQDEADLRARIGQELSSSGDLEATAATLVRIADRLLAPQSVLVLEFDGDWAVLAGHSPSRERVLAARLLQLREPLWEAALEQGPLVYAPLEEPRLLQGEGSGAAFPLGEGSLFYVGWAGQPPPSASRLAPLLAGLAGPALATARRVSSLAQEAREGARLRRSVTRLGGVLQEGWGLTARLEAGAVLDALSAALVRQVPHTTRVVRLAGAAEEPALAAVMAHGKPLLVGDVAGMRLAPLAPGERSLLAVPLGTLGAVALGAREADAFSRDDLEVVQMLAMQAALALGNAELHAQVVEALTQVRESQAALIQSSKLAAVGQLAAGVAHELNTPLGAVTLALQMGLAQRPEDASLKMAQQAAGRARDIVAKLLYYSREGAVGRQSARLDALVDDVLTMLGSQLRLDRVSVQFERGDPPAVSVSSNEIQQVLINLLINARDAVQEGGSVRVRTFQDGEWAAVEVRDGGPGVDPAIADRIFDPFFTTKPVGKGTGLGLSVSMQIVLAHEGRLELGPGPGGHFVVRLPLQR